MAMTGEKSEWSPLETHMKLQHFIWAEPQKPGILSSLLPAREVAQASDNVPGAMLWACGSPGLLVASLDLTTGSLERREIPEPPLPPRSYLLGKEAQSKSKQRFFKDGRSFMQSLSDTKAVSMVCIDDQQLWVGTERGTLHAFSVPDFSDHHAALLRDVVLCLATGELSSSAENADRHQSSLPRHVTAAARGRLRWTKDSSGSADSDGQPHVRYVLAGLANGQLLKFTLKQDDIGSYSDPFIEEPAVSFRQQ